MATKKINAARFTSTAEDTSRGKQTKAGKTAAAKLNRMIAGGSKTSKRK